MTKRVVLITGGADGIGWATAKLFADKNYKVVIADINLDRAKTRVVELGQCHVALRIDVSLEKSVVDGVEKLKRLVGKCDVLVNNAGIPDTMQPSLNQNMDDFQKILDINLNGTFMMSREIAKLMFEKTGGAIVNLSSIAGLGGLPRRNAYGSAKAAVIALTRSLGCEWASLGVRVNAVAPGYVDTPLIQKLADENRIDLGKIQRRIPMGQLAKPNDIAEAIFFLASSSAQYITGTVLSVDGGWTAFSDFGDASQT